MGTTVQDRLDSPMPWIGMYIAAASVACSITVSLDAFNGFRLKKFCLPGKYFSLNAFSLTLLAVTVKLPLDITSNTLGYNDKLARISGLVLISTSMANFMPSLGSMENGEIIPNLAALGILVITLAVNVFIHNFEISNFESITLAEEIKIEKYWTSKLVEWRESSLSIQIRNNKCRKLLHGAKRLVLNICIGFQFFFVLTSKLLLRFFAFYGGAIISCFHNIKNSKRFNLCDPNETVGLESPAPATPQLDLSPFVLLLGGETELPKRILKKICNEVDEIIEMGERKQPKNLIKLLHKSVNFNGVREFDSNEVRSLHSQEPPNCWSLPVVTLTSIALALPNVTNHEVKQLLSGVSEGLTLVNLIEKTHNKNEEVCDAADVVWIGVELYRKWEDNDLQNISIGCTSHMETLQRLSSIAEKSVADFMAETKDILMQSPLYWPAKVIAANSMYRATQTLLLAYKDDETNEDVFNGLSIIVSDILAACLTNLGHVIRLKCHKSGTKEREESVREAATLLGQSQQIFEFLEQQSGLIPSMDAENAAKIDKWRACLQEQNTSISASSNITTTTSLQKHVPIDLED